VFVVNQNLSNLKSVGYIALPDELASTNNGRSAFPYIFFARQLVQDVAGFINQVDADYIEEIQTCSSALGPYEPGTGMFSSRR
jgi:hypothetical protein